MNPFADVTNATVQAWSELDWRWIYMGEDPKDGWTWVAVEDYYHPLWREGRAQPLSERIGILRQAWISWRAIRPRVSVEFLPAKSEVMEHWPAENEVMEHWVQLRHDGVRCRYATETHARRIEGQVRVFRTFPDCLAGEGGMPLEGARALAPPSYRPPLAGHLWTLDYAEGVPDEGHVQIMRHPIVRSSARHLCVRWHKRTYPLCERTSLVNRDDLEQTGYAQGGYKTLYAARELAEALIDSEALAQWRRDGLEEDLQELGCSSFDVYGYYMAKKETLEQEVERLRRAEEYINGPRIFSA